MTETVMRGVKAAEPRRDQTARAVTERAEAAEPSRPARMPRGREAEQLLRRLSNPDGE